MTLDSKILSKDHLRIIISDSGLGGLSVHALLDKYLREKNLSKKIDLIFYNAVASHDYGYNTMPKKEEKLRVFNLALNGMLDYNPDLILIACNTLSVIYNDTNFAKTINIPVLGIVELGISHLLEVLRQGSKKNILILATETTIASNQHEKSMLKNGIDAELIIKQACKDLESEIQINPNGENVKRLIYEYVNEAYEKVIYKELELVVILACTHYGYSKKIFQDILRKQFGHKVEIINPNERMAEFVKENLKSDNKGKCDIQSRIISKVTILPEEIDTLGALLKHDSNDVFEAIKNYELNEELFQI